MMVDREAEADVRLVEALCLHVDRRVHIDPKLLKNLRGPASRSGAVSVLGDLCPAGRRDDAGKGRDVEGLRGAAGSRRIDHIARIGLAGNPRHVRAHDLGGTDDLVDGRHAGRHQREKCAHLRVGRVAGGNRLEGLAGRRLVERSAAEKRLQVRSEVTGSGRSVELRRSLMGHAISVAKVEDLHPAPMSGMP